MTPRGRIILTSEARGEFLMVEGIRRELTARGWESVHVTDRSDDAGSRELQRSGAVALNLHPSIVAARSIPATQLVDRIAQAERELGGVNLRRLWRADLRSWREGADDNAMARLTLGYLAAWRDILAAAAPVQGLWGEDGGHLIKRVPFLLGDLRPWSIQMIPIPGRVIVVDNEMNRLDPSGVASTVPTIDERATAEDLIAQVKASSLDFSNPRDMSFRPGRLVRFARLLTRRFVTRPPGSASLHPLRFARMYVRDRVTTGVLDRSYRPVGEKPFVFYPIHFGSDIQITLRAPQWENQIALIEHLAASLPFGSELVVKEHPFGVGSLPLAPFRALLRRRPEIRLVRPTTHAHALLRQCAAVATVNSTTGFEAMMFGKPVVTFGHGLYRGLGLSIDVGDPFETPWALRQALDMTPPDEADVVRLLVFLHRSSFPGRPLALDPSAKNLVAYGALLDVLATRAASA